MRPLRAVALAALIGASAVIATAEPAAAHGAGGVQPSNYETRVSGVEPATPGLQVRSIELGSRLELRNVSGVEVTVLGYDGEPYLRVGPRGVFENKRSPAVFLNRTRRPTERPPRTFDSGAPPEWERVSSGRVARWHDHRAHWMGTGDPPAVQRAPGRFHVVIPRWTIPFERLGEQLAIQGDVVWVPGPSPWPWLLGALAVAGLVVASSRTRWWPHVLMVALALLLAAETAHVVGVWDASTGSEMHRAGGSIYSLAGWVIGVVAIVWLARRDPFEATPVVLIAGLFLVITGGLAEITTLTRSQLPTSLPATTARVTVAGALGLGVGVVAAAAFRLTPPPRAGALGAGTVSSVARGTAETEPAG
jgi:hypothetical protein